MLCAHSGRDVLVGVEKSSRGDWKPAMNIDNRQDRPAQDRVQITDGVRGYQEHPGACHQDRQQRQPARPTNAPQGSLFEFYAVIKEGRHQVRGRPGTINRPDAQPAQSVERDEHG